jgi:hypothetical protein
LHAAARALIAVSCVALVACKPGVESDKGGAVGAVAVATAAVLTAREPSGSGRRGPIAVVRVLASSEPWLRPLDRSTIQASPLDCPSPVPPQRHRLVPLLPIATLLLACWESDAGAPPKCSAWSFETEGVLPSACLYDGGTGIAGDCANGACLPQREWLEPAGSITPSCAVRWWVPRDLGSEPGGCAARSFLRNLGEVDEHDRELCEVPLEVDGLYHASDSELARRECTRSSGIISFSPEGSPPPAETFITVSCWSDTCPDGG